MAQFKFRNVLLGASALCGLYAIPAQATVVLETQTLSYSSLLSGASFNLFNTTLGSLTQVIVTSTPSITYTASVTNNGSSAVVGNFNLYAEYDFTSTISGLMANMYSPAVGSSYLFDTTLGHGAGQAGIETGGTGGNPLLAFKSPSITVGAGTTSPTYSGTLTDTYTYSVSDSTDLAFWGTSGASQTLSLSVSIPAVGNFATTGGGGTTNTSVNLSDSPSGSVTIQYLGSSPPPPPPPPPTGAPEPASMLLMGAGLAGLGAVVRRKRRT